MRSSLCSPISLLSLGLAVFFAAAQELPEASEVAEPAETTASEPASSGSDWPRFLGPTGNSKSPETGILTDWPSEGPPVVWWKEVGEGYSTPVIADGRLFFFDRHGDLARLTAMDPSTGEELWRSEYPTQYEDYYEYSNGPRASPAVDGDRVYIFGVEGRLRCHRVTDGELIWEVDTTERFGVVKNFFGVGSSPVIEGDLLIVPVGGSPPGSPKIHSGEVKGNGSGIVAFDKMTGEVRYSISDELAAYATPVMATIKGRRWGFAFTRGGLLGFEPREGTIDFFYPWRSKVLESVNASTPVVNGDTVFISECYGPGSALLRVKPGGYEVVWADPPGRNKSLQTHWNTAVLDDGFLYASSGRNTGDAELRSVELATGKVAWSERGLKRSSLLHVDGHLLALGEYGTLHLLRPRPDRYETAASVDYAGIKVTSPGGGAERPLLRFPAWGAPILSKGLLYLHGKDTLVAVKLVSRRSGSSNNSRPLPRPGGVASP